VALRAAEASRLALARRQGLGLVSTAPSLLRSVKRMGFNANLAGLLRRAVG
jgi:hypothetical protein